MLPESKTKICERFLQTESRLSKETINIWQQHCKLRCVSREKTPAYYRYLEWKPNNNEIALFTSYAYADLEIPKDFSCIFDYRNPHRFTNVKMTLIQSILEAWFPIEYIDHGHKHLAIFRFEHEIPAILQELHEEKEQFLNIPKNSLCLGICQIEDYETIKKDLMHIEELRRKHGVYWHEYYEEE